MFRTYLGQIQFWTIPVKFRTNPALLGASLSLSSSSSSSEYGPWSSPYVVPIVPMHPNLIPINKGGGRPVARSGRGGRSQSKLQPVVHLYRLLTNLLHLPDRLICLSRIDQAEMFAWFAWAGSIRLGRGAWIAWAGLIRLGRGAWFAWAGLIILPRKIRHTS